MPSAFPKYSKYICNTYPDNGFVAGPTECTLQSGDVTRSRLAIGGTFFRSVETAGDATVNAINLTCDVVFASTLGDIDTYNVTFNYTDADGNAQAPIVVQQKYDTLNTVYTLNGITELRSALVGNLIVTMPIDDSAIAPAGAGSGYTSADDANHITNFVQTAMSGATGLPVDGSGIRTGPTYTLFHIASEDTAEDGSWVAANTLSEFNGVNWESYPSPLYSPAFDVNGDVVVPHPDCPDPTPIA